MPFITQGKTNLGYILIIIALAIIAGGFILGYYYFWMIEIEARLAELESRVPVLEPSNGVNCTKKGTVYTMTLADAKEIAINSECGNRLKDSYMCNEYTGTWWIDLDIKKEGCNPACVVNTETEEAEINWRCTGLIE